MLLEAVRKIQLHAERVLKVQQIGGEERGRPSQLPENVPRLIGPRGKHMRDIVALWITGRGSRSGRMTTARSGACQGVER